MGRHRDTDPQDVLIGICHACKSTVEVLRRESRPAVSTQGTGRMTAGSSGIFDDVPSAECPTCLSRSKAKPPQGTRVLLRTKPKPDCICGHSHASHIHLDWPVGEEEPTSCLMMCGCKFYEAPLPGVGT